MRRFDCPATKASSIASRCSWLQMEQVLGTYEPRTSGLLRYSTSTRSAAPEADPIWGPFGKSLPRCPLGLGLGDVLQGPGPPRLPEGLRVLLLVGLPTLKPGRPLPMVS